MNKQTLQKLAKLANDLDAKGLYKQANRGRMQRGQVLRHEEKIRELLAEIDALEKKKQRLQESFGNNGYTIDNRRFRGSPEGRIKRIQKQIDKLNQRIVFSKNEINKYEEQYRKDHLTHEDLGIGTTAPPERYITQNALFKMVKLANYLDAKGLYAEANEVTKMIEDVGRMSKGLGDKEVVLRVLIPNNVPAETQFKVQEMMSNVRRELKQYDVDAFVETPQVENLKGGKQF